MRVLLAVACLCLTLPMTAQKPASSSTTPTDTSSGDSPTDPQKGKADSLSDLISKPADKLGSHVDITQGVGTWTNWVATKGVQLVPNEHIDTFGDKLCPGTDELKDACGLKKDLYIIHIVRSRRSAADVKNSISIVSSNWYLYTRGHDTKLHRRKADDGKFPTLYNAHDGVLVSVSVLENPVCSGLLFTDCDTPGLSYDVKLTERTAANVTALTALANAVLGIATKADDKNKKLGEELIAPKYSGFVQLYEIDRTPPRLPFDWGITANVTAYAKAADGDDNSGKDKGAAKAADTGDAGTCTNIKIGAKCTFTHTVSVDGAQYWNVGINITPHGPRENRYALSNSNIVTQSHTIHSPLYAAVDFSPWSQRGCRPYFQAGVPLSGAAFHLPFVSVAEPLPFTKKALQISIYGGVVLMQQTFPRTLQVGQTSNTSAFNADLVTDRALKAIFGIEVPVSSIVSKVKSSVGSGK